MTLLEYLSPEYNEMRIDNWMTRWLARKYKGPLEDHHLELAKKILKQKCLVGFVDSFQESVERIMTYFHMDLTDVAVDCVKGFDGKHRLNKNAHKSIAPGSKEWELVAELNSFDIELFQFAKDLWIEQGHLLNITSL